MKRSSIIHLLRPSCPSAVFGVVIFVVVLAIETVSTISGFQPHIGEEVEKPVFPSPASTYYDSSILVISNTIEIFPITPSKHAVVRFVLGGLETLSVSFQRVTMECSGLNFFGVQTSATFTSGAGKNFRGANNPNFSAITKALPKTPALARSYQGLASPSSFSMFG